MRWISVGLSTKNWDCVEQFSKDGCCSGKQYFHIQYNYFTYNTIIVYIIERVVIQITY